MQREAKKLLFDIAEAARLIDEFVAGKDWPSYERERLLQSAVERQFEIIGEALNQLAKLAPDIASRISDYRRIIAFRNILIHGYANISPAVVWGVVEAGLPRLLSEVDALIDGGCG